MALNNKDAIDKEITEIVRMAREISAVRFADFFETDEEKEDPVRTAQIIRQKEWLAKNCKKVQINQPGTRTRFGYSEESIAAMKAAAGN